MCQGLTLGCQTSEREVTKPVHSKSTNKELTKPELTRPELPRPELTRPVIVTGASNGIGRAIARHLTQNGFMVLNLDRVAPDSLLNNERHIDVDLTDTDALSACLDQLTAQYQILHLVNNAGIIRPQLLADTSVDDMRLVAKINTEAPLLITQRVLPAMREQGYGRIVNICSRVTLGKQKRTAYSASKGALLAMTRTWALELASQGITVNAVGPGPIATELFMSANPPDAPQTKRIIATVPVQRLGEPDEIAHATAYFLHEKAGFTTGQILYVCGGMTVGLADV